MNRKKPEWSLGSVAGLTLTTRPALLVGFLGVWLLAAWSVAKLRNARVGLALRVGFLIAFLHFAFELLHQLGHGMAAGRTGHPMAGVRFGTYLVFATSLYPDDEPDLPADVHIRRALGGPIVSITIGLVAGFALAASRGASGLGRLLNQFIFFDNFLLLGLGAFLPLGFTDGSTILRNWRKP